MSKVQVNTGAVKKTADAIANYNQKIQNEFDKIEHAMNTLYKNWNSPSKDIAFSQYNKIKKNYQNPSKGSRYEIINSYSKSLYDSAIEDWTNAEITNVKVADDYK